MAAHQEPLLILPRLSVYWFREETPMGSIQNGIRFVGSIDEDTNLDEVLRSLPHVSPSQLLDLDLADLERINSIGVREWILFLEKLSQLSPFQFSQVSQAFIEIANSVPTILGKKGTPVLRFAAPYHCPKCSRDEVRVFTKAQIKKTGTTYQFPTELCTQCKQPLDFDALEEEYFHFLNYTG